MSSRAAIAEIGSVETSALRPDDSASATTRSGSGSVGSAASKLRINLTYLFRHGQLPNLVNPRLFNELVQHRKLSDRDARLPLLADKVLVKRFVADLIGADWVVPTLWHGLELPRVPEWPAPFVVKSRHGCNQHIFVRSEGDDWSAIMRQARAWTFKRYGFWLDEWLYGEIERGILVEPFIGPQGKLPVDYKLFVFGGRVQYVQVHLDREHHHRWIVFDRDWKRLTPGVHDLGLQRPKHLSKMIEAAETLARDLDFVRIDMYEVEDRPLFGEMTFYPGSGLDPFNPTSLDAEMGAHWLAARNDRG